MGKYETLRDAVLELTNVGEDKDLHNFIKDLSADIERMEGNEQKQKPGVTKESIMAITNPVERIQAIRANPTLFEAANTNNELENKFQD